MEKEGHTLSGWSIERAGDIVRAVNEEKVERGSLRS